MKNYLSISLFFVLVISMFGCGNSADDFISNYQSVWVDGGTADEPIEIYVDGDLAATVTDDRGYVCLPPGEYHLSAKQNGEVINETEISLPSEDEDIVEIFIYSPTGRCYALVDCAGYYYANQDITIKEAHFDEPFFKIETSLAASFYSYDVPLPYEIYSGEIILKLLPVPCDMEDDERGLQIYCEDQIEQYEY